MKNTLMTILLLVVLGSEFDTTYATTVSCIKDAASESHNSFNFLRSDSDASMDTGKITITYQQNAFRAFPVTKLECLNIADDTDTSNNLSCQQCPADSLTYSLSDTNGYLTCKLPSIDGLSTSWCSQSTTPYANNYPFLVTSCYQGIFSAETPLSPTPCAPVSSSGQILPSITAKNYLFCSTIWSTNIDGDVSALGVCSNFLASKFPAYTPGVIYQSCNEDNCNNVLICYVGNYFQIPSDDSVNTMKSSLCYATQNSQCQMDIEWTENNGYTLVGQCQRLGRCQAVTVDLTGDENTVGTQCCSTQYCNDPSSYGFYVSSSSKQSKSILVSLTLIMFVLLV